MVWLVQEQNSKRDSTTPHPRSADKCSNNMNFQKKEPRKSSLKCNESSRSRHLNVKWSVAKKASSGKGGSSTYIETCQSTSATSSCQSVVCSDSNSWTASECDEITIVGKDGSTSKYIKKTKIRRKSKCSSKDNHHISDGGEGYTKTKKTQHCVTVKEKPSRGDNGSVKTKGNSTKKVDKALLKAMELHCEVKRKENCSKKKKKLQHTKKKSGCISDDSMKSNASSTKQSDGEDSAKSNTSSTVHKHKKIIQLLRKKKGERSALQIDNGSESKKSDGECAVKSNGKCGRHRNILQRIKEKDGRVVSKEIYITSSVSSCVSENDDGCNIKKYKRLKRRRISRKSSPTATSESGGGGGGSRVTTDGYDSERSCALQPITFIPTYLSHHQNPAGEYYPMPMFQPFIPPCLSAPCFSPHFPPQPYMPPFQQATRTESSHSYYSTTSGEGRARTSRSRQRLDIVSSNTECSDNKIGRKQSTDSLVIKTRKKRVKSSYSQSSILDSGCEGKLKHSSSRTRFKGRRKHKKKKSKRSSYRPSDCENDGDIFSEYDDCGDKTVRSTSSQIKFKRKTTKSFRDPNDNIRPKPRNTQSILKMGKKSKKNKFGSIPQRSSAPSRYEDQDVESCTSQYSNLSFTETEKRKPRGTTRNKVDVKNNRFCDALQEVQKQRESLKKKLAKMGLNVEENAECLKRFDFDLENKCNDNDNIESFQSVRHDISEESFSDCSTSSKKKTTKITRISKSSENISKKERRIFNEKESICEDLYLEMDDYCCEPLNEVLACQAVYYGSVSRAKELKQDFVNAMGDVEECKDLYKEALQEVRCNKQIYKKALEKLGVPWLHEDDDLESVEEIERRHGRKPAASYKVGGKSMFSHVSVSNHSVGISQSKSVLLVNNFNSKVQKKNYNSEKTENTLKKLQCFVTKMNQNLPVFNQFFNDLNNAEAKKQSRNCNNGRRTTVKKSQSTLNIYDGYNQKQVSETSLCIKTSTTNCTVKDQKKDSKKCCPTFCEQQMIGQIIPRVQKPKPVVKRVTSRVKVYKTVSKTYNKRTMNPSEGIYFDKLTELELMPVHTDQRKNVCRDGKEVTKDRFGMNKFTAIFPLLARLEYDQFESLTPEELYEYVHNCHFGKNFDINTAIKILDEWKKGRKISNDECIFAVHKPVTYLKLCCNKPALEAAIKTWCEYFKPSVYKRRPKQQYVNK